MRIYPANFIPVEVRQKREYTKICKKVCTFFWGIIGLFIFLIIFESGAAYYFQNSREQDVPITLKNEYNQALQNTELQKKRTQLFTKAKEEDSSIIQTLSTIVVEKPSAIKLTRLEISETKIIQIDGYANDPAYFNQYVSQLNRNATFSKIAVDKISTASAGDLKMFVIKAVKAQ